MILAALGVADLFSSSGLDASGSGLVPHSRKHHAVALLRTSYMVLAGGLEVL